MLRSVLGCLVLLALSSPSPAAEVVNVYSARHYDTDDRIYSVFEKQTGIQVKLIEGNSDALLVRLKREGKRSPADVFITVDAGRLFQAERQGVFQPVSTTPLMQTSDTRRDSGLVSPSELESFCDRKLASRPGRSPATRISPSQNGKAES